MTQDTIVENVDLINRKKVFDIQLTQYGPYKIRYNVSGRHILLGGQRGHIAAIDWRKFDIKNEHNVNEQVRDIVWMMDDSMYAVAQRHFTYVYSEHGAELHRCKDFENMIFLDYLQYHFLLVGCVSHTCE